MQQITLKRILRTVLTGLVIFAASLQAQLTTGKVEGIIRDKDNGKPLQGVQVLIEGTRLGNVSNADGYYFVLNVPPGRRDITFTYTGFQKTTIGGQLILAGQTTTINGDLSGTVVQMEGITVEGESEVLVPRDNTVTKSRLTTQDLEQTPVTKLEDMLIQQAGVQTGGADALGRDLRIRGGRLGQTGMVVDGMMVRNYTALADRGSGPSGGDLDPEQGSFGQDTTPLEFSTDAVEEVDIITGGFQAEYGNANSGIINIVTKEGGEQYRGSTRYTTDGLNPRTSDYGYNQIQTSFGGPVKVVPNLYFQATAEIQGQADRTPTHASEGFRGINQDFVDRLNSAVANDPILGERTSPYTLDMFKTGREFYAAQTGQDASLYAPGNPVRLPGNWGDRTLATGKITYSPMAGLKLIASDQWTRNQNAYPIGPAGDGNYFYTGMFYKSDPTWNQSPYFRNSTDTSLYIPQSYARRVRANNLLIGGDWDFLRSATRNGLLQFRYTRFRTNEIAASSQLTNWRRESTLASWDAHDVRFEVEHYPNRDVIDDKETGLAYLPDGLFDLHINAPIETPFLMTRATAYNNQYRYSREWQNNYKADVDFQLNRHNRAKLGLQISDFSNDLFRVRQHAAKRNNLNEFAYHPKLYGAYMQNRTDLGDFVFDYGLRWDQFQPVDNWGINQGDFYGENTSPNTYTELSPRFDVAFPVTDKSQLRFSYGVFQQIPSFNVMFTYEEYGGNENPGGLGFSRTDAFETGLSYLVSPNMVLDVVTYYRDINGDVGRRPYFRDYYQWHTQQRIRDWNFGYTNRDNGNTKGFDLTLKKRFSDNFSYNLMYTMQFVRTTGSSELSGSTFDPSSGVIFEPPDQLRASSSDQTHKMTGQINYLFPEDFKAGTMLNPVFKNLSIYGVYQLLSGQPTGYAQTDAYRGRWFSNLDLRFNKSFHISRTRRVAAFVEVFNALNRKTNARYPKDYRLEPYLHGITGGVNLRWENLAASDFNRVRFNTDFNGDGILSVEEAGMGQLAYDVMMATMDKRAWGTARQIRTGVDFSF